MNKFSVGDRVVVIGPDSTYRFSRGVVVSAVDDVWRYRVIPEGISTFSDPIPYREDELELEKVYDALSAECPFDAPPVALRDDAVHHPRHYAEGWSNGAEVIDITEHLNFNRGNAVKYLARAGKKGGPEKELEDLQKALWYVRREIERLGGHVADS
jgi:hypothetical protein